MSTGLTGTWELISFDAEDQKSGQRAPFWPDGVPRGYLILTPQGRMMATLAAAGRKPGQTDEAQAALLRTMLAYSGKYRLDGDKFVTKVDVSWNEAWTGTEQVRFYKLAGDSLDIATAWMPDPRNPESIGRAILTWKRA